MNIKRGRPKKELETPRTSKEEKPTYNPTESTSFKNKTFIYKDGTHCTVMYTSCKDKQIEIKVL